MSCGVGHRHGSDSALLWLWHRPAATAPISPLAWEPPCAMGVALEKKKKKEKKKNPGGEEKDTDEIKSATTFGKLLKMSEGFITVISLLLYMFEIFCINLKV